MSQVKNENVDAAEIEKFSALASRWWDPNSEFKPLHQINPLRLNYIIRKAGSVDGVKILDVGCGGGILAESLAKQGAEVTAIDMAEASLSVARLHQLESGTKIDYRQATAEQLAENMPAAFDIVTCMEMLEHVPDPSAVVKACCDLCRPGGMVFFSTINRTFKAFMLAIVGAEYVLNLLPRGTHQYEKFIRPSELDNWARNAGLEFVESIGMHYNPITDSYRLGTGTDVNYIVCYRKPD